MIQKILTHPGGAHKDELLAVCILVATHGVPVVRRDPTDVELSEPRIAVVDVGGSDDAGKSNFDHHRYPREHKPTCALSLVLQHLGLYEDALNFCDWLEPAEWLDSRGPNQTAQWLGVPRRIISQLNSPIDVTLLRRFGQETELMPGSTLYECMRFVGEDLLDRGEIGLGAAQDLLQEVVCNGNRDRESIAMYHVVRLEGNATLIHRQGWLCCRRATGLLTAYQRNGNTF